MEDDRPVSDAVLVIALSFMLVTGAISLVDQYMASADSTVAQAATVGQKHDSASLMNN